MQDKLNERLNEEYSGWHFEIIDTIEIELYYDDVLRFTFSRNEYNNDEWDFTVNHDVYKAVRLSFVNNIVNILNEIVGLEDLI